MQIADRGLVALRRGSVQTADRVDGRREKRQTEMNREHPDFAFCLSTGKAEPAEIYRNLRRWLKIEAALQGRALGPA